MTRVVSLVPGATETLFALGLRFGDRIAAAGARRTVVFDGPAYFNRPGPRLVDSLELPAAAVAGVSR